MCTGSRVDTSDSHVYVLTDCDRILLRIIIIILYAMTRPAPNEFEEIIQMNKLHPAFVSRRT